jgi:hypothetical protein
MRANALESWSRRRDLNPRPSDYKSESGHFKPFAINTK